jgi:hypothetical protein
MLFMIQSENFFLSICYIFFYLFLKKISYYNNIRLYYYNIKNKLIKNLL